MRRRGAVRPFTCLPARGSRTRAERALASESIGMGGRSDRRLSGRPRGGKQRASLSVRQAFRARNAREHITQVPDRVDTCELARSENRKRNGRTARAVIGAGKEHVPAHNGRPPVRSLDHAVINRQPTIVEKSREGDAMIVEVTTTTSSTNAT